MIGILLALAVDAAPYPFDYDKTVQSELQDTLKDYDSAKIKFIRGPRMSSYTPKNDKFFKPNPPAPIWYVCYSVNSKNSYGGYTGYKTYMAGIVDGKVVRSRVSPYYNEYSGRERDDSEVVNECAAPADDAPPTK